MIQMNAPYLYLYFKLREEINILSQNAEFKARLLSSVGEKKFKELTKKEKYFVGTDQEVLFCEFIEAMAIDDCQNAKISTLNNLKNGDLFFENSFIDLKVSSKEYASIIGSLGKNSVDNFRDDGYYLICSLDFTKRLLLPKKVILEKLSSNELNYIDDSYIKGHDLWDILNKDYYI